MNILFASKEMKPWGHLGLKHVSSMLKKAGHHAEAVEADFGIIAKKIKGNRFDLIGYSSFEKFIPYYLRLNRELKRRFNFLSVFGGVYSTVKPEVVEQEGVDVVCMGEGEYATLELMDNLSNNKDIIGIESLWVKKDNKIYRNPMRSPVKDLDALPFPDRNLYFDKFSYLYDSIITSRGCVFSCSYCCSAHKYAMYQKNFRQRSVDNVIEELRQMKSMQKYKNLRTIRFEDSVFTITESWLRDFSKKYKKEIGIPFFCNSHASTITKATVEYLKDAGCVSTSLGIECADDFLRKTVLNRDISKKDIMAAIELLKSRGIKVRTTNLLAIPMGSLESDLETLKFNRECSPDYSVAFPVRFYSGTAISNLKEQASRTSLRDLQTDNEADRLKFLFSVLVEFPVALPVVKRLVRLPFKSIYKLLHIIWEAYCLHFRIYVTGWRGFLREFKRAKKVSKILQFFCE